MEPRRIEPSPRRQLEDRMAPGARQTSSTSTTRPTCTRDRVSRSRRMDTADIRRSFPSAIQTERAGKEC